RGIGRPTHFRAELGIDDLMLYGPASRLGPVRDAELRVGVLDVVLGGPRRDEQPRCDLACCSPVGQEAKHFDLPAAEAPGPGLRARLRARVAQRGVELLTGV